MRIGGAYIGVGLGDSSDEIRKLKAHMRRKFGYAKNLADTNLFDQQMVDAVVEMQERYNAAGQLKTGKYTPGVINYATKVVMGFVPPPAPVDTRPVLFTVCGTGVPWWVGPDADTARAVEYKYFWQPIGYPARPVPMGPSIQAGRDELYVQMNKHRDRVLRYGCAFASYSQGAIVVAETWQFDILAEGGRLAWARPCVRKGVFWGNPMRARGDVSPDAGGSPSPSSNGGVTETLMTATPIFRQYAHAGDLYADVPDDESGENRTAIWKVIRNGDISGGPNSLLRQFLELGGLVRDGSQVAEATGMFKAMIDAAMFFGQQTAPHTNYSINEAIEYLKAA